MPDGHPATGAGRTPNVRRVDNTHGNGVTTAHRVGAGSRPRSASMVRLPLKTANAPSAPTALTASTSWRNEAERRRPSVGSVPVSAARRYARITVPQHTWVRAPDTAKAVAEAVASGAAVQDG